MGYFGKPQDNYFKVWLNTEGLFEIDIRSKFYFACFMPIKQLLRSQEDVDSAKPCSDIPLFAKHFSVRSIFVDFSNAFQTNH